MRPNSTVTRSNVIDFRIARLQGVTKQIGHARRRGEYAKAEVLLLVAEEILVALKDNRPQRPVRPLDESDELLPAFLRRQAE